MVDPREPGSEPDPDGEPDPWGPAYGAIMLGAGAVGACFLGPLLAWIQRLTSTAGVIVFFVGGVLGLVTVGWGLVARREGATRGGPVAVVLGTVAVAAVIGVLAPALARPVVTDATTAPDDPPPLPGGIPYAGPTEGGPRRIPPALSVPRAADWVFADLVVFARGRNGWEIEEVDSEERLLFGTAQSPIFRFDDVYTVRVRPVGPERSVVDMRMRALEPGLDPGREPYRIRAFLDDFAETLQSEEAPEGPKAESF